MTRTDSRIVSMAFQRHSRTRKVQKEAGGGEVFGALVGISSYDQR
jgi:hypothetical protein